MARTTARAPLQVFLNGLLVGRLRRERSGAIDFQYDESWLGWKHGFAISLSLPLRADRYLGDPVIAVFDNLLPDSGDIRRRLAARHHADGTDPYSLLAVLGRDCIGALQFLPEGSAPGQAGEVRARPIDDEDIARRLENLHAAPLGIADGEVFRISLAGAQEKTALLHWNNRWHIPEGSTATTHILKPQIGDQDGYDLSQSVENEYLCMQILGELGMPVAETQIVDFVGARALVVERFDRRWTQDGRLLRLPQEDCCQALSMPPTRKYQADGGPGIVDILRFLKGSDQPADDQLLFLKAQIAFWLLAATDGHAKNFSVLLYPRGGFQLAPLYDVMSTQHLFDTKQLLRKHMRLAMAVGNNRHYRLHEALPRHFKQSAARAGVPDSTVDAALNQVADTLPGAIERVGSALPADFPAAIYESIARGARSRLRLIGTPNE